MRSLKNENKANYAHRLAEYMREEVEKEIAKMLGRDLLGPQGRLVFMFQDGKGIKLRIRNVKLGPGFLTKFRLLLGEHLRENYPIKSSSLIEEDPWNRTLTFQLVPMPTPIDLEPYFALKKGRDLFE
jgi:hypothetical protein